MSDTLGATESRIETLLSELRADADPSVVERAEELVRALVELYGSGLGRIVELVLDADDPAGGRAVMDRLLADRLVTSLLVLHDLHPVTVEDRIDAALEKVRPYLGSHAGGVEFLGVDAEGIAHVKLQGSCEGCASSIITVKYAIEEAILDVAPEVVRVEAEGVPDAPPAPAEGPALHQIGSRPGGQPANGDSAASGAGAGGGAEPGGGWTRVEGLRLLPGQTTVLDVGGASLLVCSVAGSLYAYRNRCAACGSALDGGALDAERFTCPGCATSYDVRLAGRGVDDEALHLEPVPLLPDAGEVKVAIPQGAMR